MRNIIKSTLVSIEAARTDEVVQALLIGPVSSGQCVCIHLRPGLTGTYGCAYVKGIDSF